MNIKIKSYGFGYVLEIWDDDADEIFNIIHFRFFADCLDFILLIKNNEIIDSENLLGGRMI